MANKRIYYAIQQVKLGTGSNKQAVHGLQSAGITTNFNLEQVFEMGQLEIYQNVENVPEIEVTLNKVLDGYPTLYVLATETGTTLDSNAIATGTDLAGRQNARVDLELGIFRDNKPSVQGSSISAVTCRGMYVSSVSYTFPVDGNSTEDLTLVGNDKLWGTTATAAPAFSGNNDSPNADAGVSRRQHLDMTRCKFPRQIPGINSSGANTLQTGSSGVGYNVHFQNVTVSCDLGREAIFELGSFAPYTRYVTFPVEVTSEFEVLSIEGDKISATQDGYYVVSGNTYTADPNNSQGVAGCSVSRSNLINETIELYTCEGTQIKLGGKNKLTSVNYNGGDTGGGNVTVTYSYTTFNTFNVAHEEGPLFSAVS